MKQALALISIIPCIITTTLVEIVVGQRECRWCHSWGEWIGSVLWDDRS